MTRRKRAPAEPHAPRSRCPKAPVAVECCAYRGLGAPPGEPRCMYCERPLPRVEPPLPPLVAGAALGRAPPDVWRTAGDPHDLPPDLPPEVRALADQALDAIDRAIPLGKLASMLEATADEPLTPNQTARLHRALAAPRVAPQIDRCITCGGPCDVACLDYAGRPYLGCRECFVSLPDGKQFRQQSTGRITVGPLQEPIGGWRLGFWCLIQMGRCPWCGYPIREITVSREHGVCWSCFDGCNP